MEAIIREVENGYTLRLVDYPRHSDYPNFGGIVGEKVRVYVFREGDLKGAFERIDRFFLGCGEPREERKGGKG